MTDRKTLTKKIVAFISGRTTFTQGDLKAYVKAEKQKILPILQKLVQSQRLQVCKDNDGSIFWKVRTIEDARKYNGLTNDHLLVLQEIRKSGSKGVWVRTIKARTKLANLVISKILKQLEQRQLIKSVKSIAAKKQKLYIAFDVTPDKEHTGGVWYNEEGEFDEEYVRYISKWTLAMIKQHGSQSLQDLVKNLKQSKVSKVSLSEEDFHKIIDKLRYENEIEEFIDPNAMMESTTVDSEPVHSTKIRSTRWKVVNKVSCEQFLTRSVCGVCPVSDKCCIGGVISPTTCIYMDDWLGSSNLRF